MTEIANVIRERRTVHLFDPEPVGDEVLLEAFELARWAPNHHLTEPWRFHLLGSQTREKIIERNTLLVAEKRGETAADEKRKRWLEIPGMFAVTCLRSEDPNQETEDYAACCCAVQNLMLYLWTRNVGVKWSTGAVVRCRGFVEFLGESEEETRPVGLFFFGRPQKVPPTKRQPVESLIRRHP